LFWTPPRRGGFRRLYSAHILDAYPASSRAGKRDRSGAQLVGSEHLGGLPLDLGLRHRDSVRPWATKAARASGNLLRRAANSEPLHLQRQIHTESLLSRFALRDS